MQPVKLTSIVAGTPDSVDDRTVFSIENPDRIVLNVWNDQIALFGIMRESDTSGRAALARLGCQENFLLKLPLFGEYLDSITAPIRDIDEAVVG